METKSPLYRLLCCIMGGGFNWSPVPHSQDGCVFSLILLYASLCVMRVCVCVCVVSDCRFWMLGETGSVTGGNPSIGSEENPAMYIVNDIEMLKGTLV